jgi:hypothetical protein
MEHDASFGCWLTFASLSDPDLVLVAVAHRLDVGTTGRQPLSERLGRYLRTRQILLVRCGGVRGGAQRAPGPSRPPTVF